MCSLLEETEIVFSDLESRLCLVCLDCLSGEHDMVWKRIFELMLVKVTDFGHRYFGGD